MAGVKAAVLGFVVFAAVTCAQTVASRVPRFDDYPVEVQIGAAMSAKLNGAADAWPDSDIRFRDAVADAFQRGVKFAGHFTIVQWSCGTGCSNSLLADTETGVLYRQSP